MDWTGDGAGWERVMNNQPAGTHVPLPHLSTQHTLLTAHSEFSEHSEVSATASLGPHS